MARLNGVDPEAWLCHVLAHIADQFNDSFKTARTGRLLFTHLPQLDVNRHLHDIYKTLKPGGLFLFSFLEIDKHRPQLEGDTTSPLHDGRTSSFLDMCLSGSEIAESAEKLGFKIAGYIESDGDAFSIGQTTMLLKTP